MHYQREVCLPLGHEKRSGATTHDLSDIEHGYTVSGIAWRHIHASDAENSRLLRIIASRP